MRKQLTVWCAVLLLTAALCGGCTRHRVHRELCADFKAAFSADYRGMQLAGTMLCTRQGDCHLAFSQPQTLGGLALRYQNNTLRISRDNALCTADEGYLPEGSFPETVRRVMKGVAQGRAKPVAGSEAAVYRLSDAALSCEITADDDGMIQTVAVKNEKLTLRLRGAEKL